MDARAGMYVVFALIAILAVAAVPGCSNDDDPAIPAPDLGVISYHDSTYVFDTVECMFANTSGNAIPEYTLSLTFTDDSARRIEFSIRELYDSTWDLLIVGRHEATGRSRDRIVNNLVGVTIAMNGLAADQLAMVWEDISLEGHQVIHGRGYIEIPRRLDYACADSIYVDGGYVGPGDPDYEAYVETCCEPGFFFPAQKIWFVCEDGSFLP